MTDDRIEGVRFMESLSTAKKLPVVESNETPPGGKEEAGFWGSHGAFSPSSYVAGTWRFGKASCNEFMLQN